MPLNGSLVSFRDPNVGPFSVPVVWNEFRTLQQNYLNLAPEVSMKAVDVAALRRYRFWMEEFPAMVEVPPDPTLPLPEAGKDGFNWLERQRPIKQGFV